MPKCGVKKTACCCCSIPRDHYQTDFSNKLDTYTQPSLTYDLLMRVQRILPFILPSPLSVTTRFPSTIYSDLQIKHTSAYRISRKNLDRCVVIIFEQEKLFQLIALIPVALYEVKPGIKSINRNNFLWPKIIAKHHQEGFFFKRVLVSRASISLIFPFFCQL